jgi:hypothetical protein
MNAIMHRIDPNKELSQLERYRKKLKIIQDVIYGVDIQPVAVQIAQLRLFLSLIQEIVPDKRKDNYGIAALPNLETKFVCADTLIGLKKEKQGNIESPIVKATVANLLRIRNEYLTASMPSMKKTLRELDQSLRNMLSIAMEDTGELKHATAKLVKSWNPYEQKQAATFFDPVLMFGVEKFDIVIGNPPYVSAPTMVATNPEGRQAIIDSNRFTTLYQKWDLYVPFMEFGLQILTENGILTMIVPYPLTNQIYAKKIRELIIRQYNLIEIADLKGTKIFKTATVSNCIPFIIKSSPDNRCYVSHIDEQKKITRSFVQNYSDLVIDSKNVVWNLTKARRKTDRHAQMNVLGDFCYISVGMVLNSDEITAKGTFVKKDLISTKRDQIHCREYIEAKDVERYRVKRIRYLEYNTERCPDKLRRSTFRELYQVPKLVMNSFGIINVTLDEKQKFLHNHSIVSAVLWKDLAGVKNKSLSASVKRYSMYSRKDMETYSERIDRHYLLGILNSRYASVLLSNLRGGGFCIYPEHLRNMPIPLVEMSQQRPIISLVKKILSAKNDNPAADTAKWEQKIDALVYKLYGLTDEEITLIERTERNSSP